MKVVSVRLDATNEQQLNDIYAFYGVSGSSETEKFRDFLVKASKLALTYKVSEIKADPVAKAEIQKNIAACTHRKLKEVVIPKSKRLDDGKKTETAVFCIWGQLNKPPLIKRIEADFCETCKDDQYRLQLALAEAKKQELEAAKSQPIQTPTPQPIQRPIERPQATVFKSAPSPQPKTKYPLVHGYEEYAFVEKPDGSRLCPFHSGETIGLGWKYVYFSTDCKKCRATTPDKAKQCNEVRLYLHALKRPQA